MTVLSILCMDDASAGLKLMADGSLGLAQDLIALARKPLPVRRQGLKQLCGSMQAQLHVLVVDDSELVRRTLVRKINEYGHATNTAANGEEAMAMLLGHTYRIVFLDVMMPGLDGLEICRRIKRSPEYKVTAVYMLTSKDGMFDRVRATMAGCDGYLVKPLESRRLREVLEKYFDRPANFSPNSLLAKEPFNPVELTAIEGMPEDWHGHGPKEEFQVPFAHTVPMQVATKRDTSTQIFRSPNSANTRTAQ